MHKNSQNRIIEEGAVYFITTNTHRRYPFFRNNLLGHLFITQLKLTKILKEFELYAFCVLYDHVHLIVKPSEKFDITKIMFSLKKQYTHSANRVMGYIPMKPPSSTPESVQTFARFPQVKMIGYINKLHRIYNDQHRNGKKSTPKFKWQPSYHDHIIRSTKDFLNHVNYTAENYKKHYHPDGKIIYPMEYQYTSENYSGIIDDYEV